ncbi:MAG: hypothetical protein ACFB03_04160 [Paracoccaceae bacterium]
MEGMEIRIEEQADAPDRQLLVNVAKYQHFLDKADISEDQKAEFLANFWQIVVAFVDLGFGVHPVQQACGKLSESEPHSPLEWQNLLNSDHQPTTQFENAAARAGKDESA